MPTIDQLQPVPVATDTDQVLVSQNGTARKMSRAQMLAGTQHEIAVPQYTLLGRASPGTGAPETLAIGSGLSMNGGVLSVATTGFDINTLPPGTVPASTDLVPLGQNGGNVAISYAQLLSGLPGVASIDASNTIVKATGSTANQKMADFAANTLPKSGGQMSGPLVLAADPFLAKQATTKQYTDAAAATRVTRSGDTMTGALSLAADPTQAFHATTKQYTDSADVGRVQKSGDVMTGTLTLAADPTAALQAATKQYVDTSAQSVATGISVRWFGAKGDGVTNDTAAFSAAFASLASPEGIVFCPKGQYYLPSGLTVPHGITLTGEAAVGEALPDGTWGFPVSGGRHDYRSRGTILILPRGQSIGVGNRAALRNLFIMPADMLQGSPSQSAAAATVTSYAGTAVVVQGSDVVLDSVWIWGYNLAVLSNGFERAHFRRVTIDCTNGVEVTASTDWTRIEYCECMPFYTTGHNSNLTGNLSILFRSGIAFNLHDQTDGATIRNSGAYGYAIGLQLKNAAIVSVTDCWFDNAIANAVSGSTVGIKTLGQLVACSLDNITVLEQQTGIDCGHGGGNSVLAIGSVFVGMSSTAAGSSLMRVRPGARGTVGQFRGSASAPYAPVG